MHLLMINRFWGQTMESSSQANLHPANLSLEKELDKILTISQKLPVIISCQYLTSFFEELTGIFNFDNGMLLLYDKEKKQLRCEASMGYSKEAVQRIEKQALKQYPGWVFENCNPLLIQNFAEEKSYRPLGKRTRSGSACIVPLMFQDRCLGVLGLESQKESAFQTFQLPLLNLLANQIQLTLENRRLFNQTETVEKNYKSLFDRIEIPLFITSVDGKIINVNQAYLDLLGYKRKKQSLQLDITTHIFHLQDRQRLQLMMTKHHRIHRFEAQLKNNDDKLLTVFINGEPIKDRDGKITGYEGSILNQTELRLIEDQLVHAQKMQSIGTLTGEITHDFNNLIGGIMGYASLILSDMTEANPYYNDVQTILAGSRKAAALTTQLLSFFKKEKHQVRPINVNEVVNVVINMISSTFDKSIEVESDLCSNIASVEADINRIQQIIMNLCINARDAMPNGGTLRIETENCIIEKDQMEHPFMNEGSYIITRVTDTGIGMTENIIKQIFQPFYTSKGKEGSGLGLAIADRIIKHYGGTIQVISKPGEGSTFEIYLPASEIIEVEETKQADEKAIPFGNETILLVDDDEIIRKMGKRTLETYGYQVLLAADGNEAVDIYQEKMDEIHLVILDLIMPNMDGKKAFQALKQINPGIKALLASGTRQTTRNNPLIESGECGFIQKPFMASQILHTIRRTLEGECVCSEDVE